LFAEGNVLAVVSKLHGGVGDPMTEKPSFLTSTTSLVFLLTVTGFIGFCFWTKNSDGMIKLLEMVVPAALMNKGMQMGQNGKAKLPPTPEGHP
jgi:hypothetical protein